MSTFGLGQSPTYRHRNKGNSKVQQPGRPEDLNITEMRFYSDTLESPIRFILESFTLLGGEEGRWTLTIAHRDYGPPDYDLEYYATIQFGKRVHQTPVFQWDHEKEEMDRK
jgi:hypothetical protein